MEGVLRTGELFEVCQPLLDRRIGGIRRRAGEHLLGKVQPEDGGRALLPRPAGKPAEPAAQVDDTLAGTLGKHGADRGPLRRAGAPLDLPWQAAIAGKASVIVTNFLHVVTAVSSGWIFPSVEFFVVTV